LQNVTPCTLAILNIHSVIVPLQSIHTSVMHSLTCIPLEVMRSSNRVEWLPLLHSIAMMHASLRLRGQVCPYAWSNGYHWNYNHLMVCCYLLWHDTCSFVTALASICMCVCGFTGWACILLCGCVLLCVKCWQRYSNHLSLKKTQ